MSVITISIADAATGQFTGRVKTLPAELVALNVPEGCIAVEGHHDALCRRVDLASGQVVPFQPPAPASDEHHDWAWDGATERWVARLTLAGHKAQAWSAIKSRRDAARVEPLCCLRLRGITVDVDEASRAALGAKAQAASTALQLGQDAWICTWTTTDNSRVQLDARDLLSLVAELDARDQLQHDHSQALRARLDAALTRDDVDAVQWTLPA